MYFVRNDFCFSGHGIQFYPKSTAIDCNLEQITDFELYKGVLELLQSHELGYFVLIEKLDFCFSGHWIQFYWEATAIVCNLKQITAFEMCKGCVGGVASDDLGHFVLGEKWDLFFRSLNPILPRSFPKVG